MVKPMGSRVLVEVIKLDEIRGGILIPKHALDREQRAQTKGRFVDAGVLAEECIRDIVPRTEVIFARYSGSQPIEDDGRLFFLINDVDVLAIITENKGDVTDG